MMSVPLVSVIMPVYNGAMFIGAAIESILAQSYANFELIIIDDGSTDDSRKIVDLYRDDRICLTIQDTNRGLVHTRNNGIKRAGGAYIAMLDSDDIASPDRLREQVSFLEAHPDFVMVGSRLNVIDEFGRLTGENWDYPYSVESISSRMLFHNCFAQSAVCIRRSSLTECVYRPEYPTAEDYDLWVRLAKTGKVWNLPRYLLLHRRYSQSTSARQSRALEQSVCRIIRSQLQELGVEPTDEELSLHRSVGEQIYTEWSLESLQELETWLLKLYHANQKKRIFCASVFNDMISDRWYCACFEAAAKGVNIRRIYFGSLLNEIGKSDLARDCKFFLRATVNGFFEKNRAKTR